MQQQQSKSHSKSDQTTTAATTTTPTGASASQTFKKGQEGNNKNNNAREDQGEREGQTKVGLNDILRRIRHLIVEGRCNLEIQNILQLEERTFYRYLAKTNEIDQALFAEEGKKKTLEQNLAYSKIDCSTHTAGILQWQTLRT